MRSGLGRDGVGDTMPVACAEVPTGHLTWRGAHLSHLTDRSQCPGLPPHLLLPEALGRALTPIPASVSQAPCSPHPRQGRLSLVQVRCNLHPLCSWLQGPTPTGSPSSLQPLPWWQCVNTQSPWVDAARPDPSRAPGSGCSVQVCGVQPWGQRPPGRRARPEPGRTQPACSLRPMLRPGSGRSAQAGPRSPRGAQLRPGLSAQRGKLSFLLRSSLHVQKSHCQRRDWMRATQPPTGRARTQLPPALLLHPMWVPPGQQTSA